MKAILFYEDKNVVYRNIRRFRKKKRMSQTQLAAKMQVMNVNIDQQMISKIERNQRFVSDFEFACFCRIFGVTPEEMLSDFYEKYPE